MARRGAAIGLFPAHATDAKVSSEPGTASRGRRASNRRSQRPRRGAFRGARDPAFPRLIESRRPRERLTFPPRSVPAGQAVLQDVLRHQGAAHRRRQGTSARDPHATPHAERATIARRPPRPLGAFGSVDTVITDILKPPPRATIERPALRRRSRSRLNGDGSFAAPGPRTRRDRQTYARARADETASFPSFPSSRFQT